VQIVVERDGTGHTAHFARVRPTATLPPRTLADIEITAIDRDMLVGSPVLREAA
jgi:hypothetical protein